MERRFALFPVRYIFALCCPADRCTHSFDYLWQQLTPSALVKSFSSRWSQRWSGEPYPRPDTTLQHINVRGWKIAPASLTRVKDENVCICVYVLEAGSVTPDWFQTGVFCGFWKGNTPCPPFALVLLLHSLYPFNWWMSPKRLANTLQPATSGERRGQRRGGREEKRTREEQRRGLKRCWDPLPATSLLLYSTLLASILCVTLSLLSVLSSSFQRRVHPSGHRPFQNSLYCSTLFLLITGRSHFTPPLHSRADRVTYCCVSMSECAYMCVCLCVRVRAYTTSMHMWSVCLTVKGCTASWLQQTSSFTF